MEQRVTTYSQYAMSTNVTGIKNMEAQTLNGISVQKVYFQPDVKLDLAISQVVAATNAIRAVLPAGIQPPIVVQYNASSVPVLQLSLKSDHLNEQQLYDYGIYNLRQQLAPVPGVTFPTPDGGKYRQIMVDVDPLKLQAEPASREGRCRTQCFQSDERRLGAREGSQRVLRCAAADSLAAAGWHDRGHQLAAPPSSEMNSRRFN
jgi:Cu/Ag efflux pump CusA